MTLKEIRLWIVDKIDFISNEHLPNILNKLCTQAYLLNFSLML